MKTPKRKAPCPVDLRIAPNDPENWTAVYIEFGEECVCIKEESFNAPDPYKMIILSNDQWNKIRKIDERKLKRMTRK